MKKNNILKKKESLRNELINFSKKRKELASGSGIVCTGDSGKDFTERLLRNALKCFRKLWKYSYLLFPSKTAPGAAMSPHSSVSMDNELLEKQLTAYHELRKELLSFLQILGDIWQKLPSNFPEPERLVVFQRVADIFFKEIDYHADLLDALTKATVRNTLAAGCLDNPSANETPDKNCDNELSRELDSLKKELQQTKHQLLRAMQDEISLRRKLTQLSE